MKSRQIDYSDSEKSSPMGSPKLYSMTTTRRAETPKSSPSKGESRKHESDESSVASNLLGNNKTNSSKGGGADVKDYLGLFDSSAPKVAENKREETTKERIKIEYSDSSSSSSEAKSVSDDERLGGKSSSSSSPRRISPNKSTNVEDDDDFKW